MRTNIPPAKPVIVTPIKAAIPEPDDVAERERERRKMNRSTVERIARDEYRQLQAKLPAAIELAEELRNARNLATFAGDQEIEDATRLALRKLIQAAT